MAHTILPVQGFSASDRFPERPLARLTALLTIVAAVACSGDAQHHQAPGSARDDLQSWSAADTVLVIGTSDTVPAYTFHRIRSVFRQQNGTVVVADAGSREVRLFGAEGIHIKSFGRAGGGPGEFSTLISAASYLADSIITYDAMARRISVWTPEGSFHRSIPIEFEQLPLNVGFVDGRGFVGMLPRRAHFPPHIGDRVTDSVSVILISAHGDSLEHLGTYTAGERIGVKPPSGSGRMMLTRLPFDPQPRLWLGRAHYYHAEARDWTFRRYAFNASKVDSIMVQLPVARLSVDTKSNWIRQSATRVDLAFRPAYMRMVNDIPYPEFLPAFDQALEDESGHAWLRAYATPEMPDTEWFVITNEGNLAARVLLGRNFQPHHIGRDFMLGVLTDGDGREQVLQLKLTREAGSTD